MNTEILQQYLEVNVQVKK